MNLRIGLGSGVSLTFHSRTVADNGWVTSYFVTAEAANFSATIEVDNAPYGTSPAELFADIAAKWSGWQGTMRWQALEGEYELQATSDSTGHITIVAVVNSIAYPPSWEAKVSIVVEAGSVDRLAVSAREFFGPTAAGART